MVLRASAASGPGTEAGSEAVGGGELIAAARTAAAGVSAATGACLGLLTGPLLAGWQALVNAPAEPLPDEWRRALAPFLPHDFQLDDVRICAPARLPVPRPYVGLTLGTTIFLRGPLGPPRDALRALLLHELAHVAQFRRLGYARMCAAYGAGLFAHGYHAHPMEVEARAAECVPARGMP